MMATGVDGISEFANFIRSIGFEPPDRIEPGQFVRFSANGKPSNSSASAKLFADLEGGIVWNWQTGEEWLWQAKREHTRTPAETHAYRARCEKAKADAKAERERELEETAQRAEKIHHDSTPADASHPYLSRKAVGCYGLRIYRGSLALRGMRCDGALILARRTAAGRIVSLQFIAADGQKRYLNGPAPEGTYYAIGKPEKTLYIAEGCATAATIHEVTGCAVAVAFDSGNLPAVTRALRAKLPEVRLIVAADDDWKVKRNGEAYNPGIEAATVAARESGALIAIPRFGVDRADNATDFNDMAASVGADAVRAALEAAQAPQAITPVSHDQPAPENVATARVESGWPEPKAIPQALRAVAKLERDFLPEVLQPWAVDIAERLQCPSDFVAVGIVVALGSVIGRRVGIRPQAETDWTEYPNLWGCIVGRPSVMKSPALEQTQAPLRRLGAKALDSYRMERELYEGKAQLAKLRREAADAEVRKRLKISHNASVDDLRVEDPPEPALKRYVANDTSYESLGALLETNPNGLLVFRDELVSLLKTLDREDNAGARGFYLTGWNGNSPYTFDRITRQGAALDAVCLSLLGSTQPGRIADYIRAANKGTAGDDGLIQRFGLLVWPDTDGNWRDVDRQPDAEAARAAFETFDRLDKLDPLTIGAQQDRSYEGTPTGQPYLRLDPEALAEFRKWREGHERKLAQSEDSPALVSHLAKYRKLVPALALTCHLADKGTGDVNAVSVLRALAWAEYLETHARRAYASLDVPEQVAAGAILARLRKHELASPFQARDVYRKGWAHLSDRQLVLDALELLTDLDWLAASDQTSRETGGRPSRTYTVNPRAMK